MVLACRTSLALSFCLALPTAAQEVELPPAEVGVVIAMPETFPVITDLPGRIGAMHTAEVRARVGGLIESVAFQQGGRVKEGDVLFRLDRAALEIAVEAARANVASADAALAEAKAKEARLTTLNERNITSKAEIETARAVRLQAEAAVAAARAQLRASEINLGFTEVRAPIDGRVGRAMVTEGALVGAEGVVLTTVQDIEHVYADLQQPVADLLFLRRALAEGALTQVAPDAAKVTLVLDNGTTYPLPGKLLFSEAAVDRSSGQITVRAEFPNPDGLLLPGMYVRVQIEQAEEAGVIALPAQAVQRDASGATSVQVVNAKDLAELRAVTLGRTVGTQVTVHDGLAAGDVVVVDGFQKIAPGAPVVPICWTDALLGEEAPPLVCSQTFAPKAE